MGKRQTLYKKKQSIRKKKARKEIRRAVYDEALQGKSRLQTAHTSLGITNENQGNRQNKGNLTFFEVGLSRLAKTEDVGGITSNYIPGNSTANPPTQGLDDLTALLSFALDIEDENNPDETPPLYTTVKQYNQHVYIDECRKTIMFRNNSNIGVIFRIYYLSPRTDVSQASHIDSTVLIKNRVLGAMSADHSTTTTYPQNYLGFSRTLYDYPTVCSLFYIKMSNPYILYPGETMIKQVVSPIEGKVKQINKIWENSSNRKYHRAMVVQTASLPAHQNPEVPMAGVLVQGAPYQVDVVVEHTIKWHEIVEPNEKDQITPNLVYQPPVTSYVIHPATNETNVVVTNKV